TPAEGLRLSVEPGNFPATNLRASLARARVSAGYLSSNFSIAAVGITCLPAARRISLPAERSQLVELLARAAAVDRGRGARHALVDRGPHARHPHRRSAVEPHDVARRALLPLENRTDPVGVGSGVAARHPRAIGMRQSQLPGVDLELTDLPIAQ